MRSKPHREPSRSVVAGAALLLCGVAWCMAGVTYTDNLVVSNTLTQTKPTATNSLAGSLKVTGGLTVDGAMSVPRQGDVSMGNYTNGAPYGGASSPACLWQANGTNELHTPKRVSIGQTSAAYPLNVGDSLWVSSGGIVYAPNLYTNFVGIPSRSLKVMPDGEFGQSPSSVRFKENVRPLTGTERLYQLRPVVFDFKDKRLGTDQWGLIAEEADAVLPEIVSYRVDVVVREDGRKDYVVTQEPETIDYDGLIVPMLNEMIKLKAEVEALKQKVEALSQ